MGPVVLHRDAFLRHTAQPSDFLVMIAWVELFAGSPVTAAALGSGSGAITIDRGGDGPRTESRTFSLLGGMCPRCEGRGAVSDFISPGLLRILDRLDDTPAEIVTELGETLRQSPLGVALTGVTTGFTSTVSGMPGL